MHDAYHDVHLRIEGSAVRWLQTTFLEDWTYATGERPAPDRQRASAALLPRLRSEAAGDIPVQIVTSGPDNALEPIHRMHMAAIHSSAQRAWLTTPYFVPGEPALMALTSAALRGVDVRLLVPRRSDSLVVSAAARSYYDELIAAGVKVWEYKARMLHSKTLVVDDNCAMVGTANFDNRSFRLNFEVMAVIYGPTLAEAAGRRSSRPTCASASPVRASRHQRLSASSGRRHRPDCFLPCFDHALTPFSGTTTKPSARVPRRDRPAQFAGIRTDAELNEIGEPLMLYCQPAPDYLPEPGGLPDHRHHAAAVPGTRHARARVRRADRAGASRSPAPSASATTRSASTTRSRASCSGAT